MKDDTKPMHQGYIEPQGCVASVDEIGNVDPASGKVTIDASRDACVRCSRKCRRRRGR